MDSLNYKGFNPSIMTVKDFLTKVEDRELLEVIKVDGLSFLFRSKTGELYLLDEEMGKIENEKK